MYTLLCFRAVRIINLFPNYKQSITIYIIVIVYKGEISKVLLEQSLAFLCYILTLIDIIIKDYHLIVYHELINQDNAFEVTNSIKDSLLLVF